MPLSAFEPQEGERYCRHRIKELSAWPSIGIISLSNSGLFFFFFLAYRRA